MSPIELSASREVARLQVRLHNLQREARRIGDEIETIRAREQETRAELRGIEPVYDIDGCPVCGGSGVKCCEFGADR